MSISVEEAGLERAVAERKAALERHPVYEGLRDLESLREFMAGHVFAVWDFMVLLKALQRHVTCVDRWWRPVPEPELARFVNEIVLGEESDEVAPGRVVSHFALYLEAMDEVGAASEPARRFVDALAAGDTPESALGRVGVPESVRRFVATTLRLAAGPSWVVAAAFCHGREDPIPRMFGRILSVLQARRLDCPAFRLYLERHCEVDEAHHGPLARHLVRRLCGNDVGRWDAARRAAEAALDARQGLWDALAGGREVADVASTA